MVNTISERVGGGKERGRAEEQSGKEVAQKPNKKKTKIWFKYSEEYQVIKR